LWVLLANDLSDKGLGTNDIEGGDTEKTLGVKDSLGLEDFGGDWDGRVDGVGDDEDISFWCDVGNGFDEAFDDTGVDVEEIITGHSWLACKLLLASPFGS
jgi:hypothetical protein